MVNMDTGASVRSNVIINRDCLAALKDMPDKSVDCCVTSPPYYGLRDYGVEGQIGREATPEQYVERKCREVAGCLGSLRQQSVGSCWQAGTDRPPLLRASGH